MFKIYINWLIRCVVTMVVALSFLYVGYWLIGCVVSMVGDWSFLYVGFGTQVPMLI